MAKEWILNSAMNRFQLNFSRNVGKVSEEIRKCSPKSLPEWESYYYTNVRPREHIEQLGNKLYVKITEVLAAEIDGITREDCINYMIDMVINRTYDGYVSEKQTVYGQLQDILNVKIEPAPDEWDRLYNIDFFIRVHDKFIGLQIKPAGGTAHIPEIFKEHDLQAATHRKFTERFGGEVFYIISIKKDGKKVIHNTDVIDDIQQEMQRIMKDKL